MAEYQERFPDLGVERLKEEIESVLECAADHIVEAHQPGVASSHQVSSSVIPFSRSQDKSNQESDIDQSFHIVAGFWPDFNVFL